MTRDSACTSKPLALSLLGSLLLLSCQFDTDAPLTNGAAGSVCALGEQDNDGDGVCQVDCTSADLSCETNATCSDASGSAECTCAMGFQDNDDDGTCLGACDGANACGSAGICSDTSGYVACLPVQSNLIAHYDAQFVPSVAADELDVVSLWSDRSGYGHDLVPNGVGPTADVDINGHPALNFGDGAALVTDNVPLSSELTVFAAIEWRTSNDWGSVVHHGNRDRDWAIEQVGGTQGRTHFQSSNDNSNVEINLDTDTSYILIGEISGSTRTYTVHSLNGSDNTSGGGVSITEGDRQLFLGKSDINEASNVYIGEFLYYSGALPSADQELVLNYLRERWDIYAN